jgi:16S rRNA (adenine(1408)-N(1))-methyltransferase
LCGLASSLTVHFPWGSLLRGVLGDDDAVLAGIARLLAPDAAGSVLVSVVPRDGIVNPSPQPQLVAAYARHGLRLVESRLATADDVAASHSTWAKRLKAATTRPVTLLRLRAAPRHRVPLHSAEVIAEPRAT